MRAGVALLFAFAAGALTGTALERHRVFTPAVANPSLAEDQSAAIAELQEFLDLDDAQVQGIHAILSKHQETVDQMWAQLRPEVQNAMREVHEEIAALLEPAQAERFHAWMQRHLAEPGRDH